MQIKSPPYIISSKIVHLIAEISEELTRIEINQKEIITPKLRKENRIKTLVGTLEIEGNFLGIEKVTAILEGKKVLGTMLEVAEVEGVIGAYKELEQYKFDELDDLLKSHQILMNGILKNAGNFRGVNVGVGNHIAPAAKNVQYLMQNLFNWLKDSDEHSLIKSCVFHYEFEFIHPFSDGNGRIGRLWQSVILYNWRAVFNAIPTESIVRDNQQKYYDTLEECNSLGNSTKFIEFMLTILLDAIRKNIEKNKKYVHTNVPINVPIKRIDKILNLIQNNHRITIPQIATKLKLTDKTIQRDLEKLKNANILIRVGSLKTGSWKIINNKE